jgi:hypothetical protein
MPKEPPKKPEDDAFEESLRKMVKVGAAILKAPPDSGDKETPKGKPSKVKRAKKK